MPYPRYGFPTNPSLAGTGRPKFPSGSWMTLPLQRQSPTVLASGPVVSLWRTFWTRLHHFKCETLEANSRHQRKASS